MPYTAYRNPNIGEKQKESLFHQTQDAPACKGTCTIFISYILAQAHTNSVRLLWVLQKKKTSVHLVSSLMLGSMDQSRKTWDNWSLTESPRKERKARLDVFAEKTIRVSEKNFLMLMSSNTTCQLRCLHEDHITCYWFHDSLFPMLEVWPDTVLIRKNQFLFLQWVFLTT